MKKIEFGKLAVENYSQKEMIEYLNRELIDITKNLISDAEQNSWAGIGSGINQLGNLSVILQALNEKVNGKKEPTVV